MLRLILNNAKRCNMKKENILIRSDLLITSKAVKIPIKDKKIKEDLSKKLSNMVNIYDFLVK